MTNINKNVMALLISRNAVETKFAKMVFIWDDKFGGGETGRKWNEMMENGWCLIPGTTILEKVKPDYNETQMERKSCCYDCAVQGFGYETGIKLVDAADWDGESGSVTIAARRLRRNRYVIEARLEAALIMSAWESEFYCDDSVAKRTNNAIETLADRMYLIQQEGEQEQQEIFETQMMRLGEHDEMVEEWRDDFETWPTFAEQLRSAPRFNRHQRGW